jgi:hypothetical protein
MWNEQKDLVERTRIIADELRPDTSSVCEFERESLDRAVVRPSQVVVD